jgi:hypothetical protein
MLPNVARAALLEAILDETPAGPSGDDDGHERGIFFGISRGLLSGMGRL